MNPFKRTGFDSLIGSGFSFIGSTINLADDSALVIDGKATVDLVTGTGKKQKSIVTITKTGCLLADMVTVDNLTISGELRGRAITVTGTLAIQKGAVVQAAEIVYNRLIIEDGAVLDATLRHKETITTTQMAE